MVSLDGYDIIFFFSFFFFFSFSFLFIFLAGCWPGGGARWPGGPPGLNNGRGNTGVGGGVSVWG